MTNAFNAANAFDDLEDAAFWADEISNQPAAPILDERGATAFPMGGAYKERCAKCRGTGAFFGRNGRRFGDCFACKGKGFLEYRTSGQDRAKARAQSASRKAANLAAWLEANADVVAWVKRRSSGDRPFDFAVELAGKLEQYGTLTDGAVAAVKRMIARDAERDAARKAERTTEAAAAPVVSIEPIVRAFATYMANAAAEARAKLGGDAERASFKAKLRLGAFFIEPSYKYAGALMVFDTSSRAVLGKLADGKFNRFRTCDDVTQAAIVEACADPEKAAVAYGRLHSSCAICGRGLDNYESIQRGIGPKCASKMGWGG